MPVTSKQLDIEFPRKWGGKQPGAGRPRGPRPRVMHRERESVKEQPVHVTFRVRKVIPKLRNRKFFNAFRQTLALCSDRNGFRVIHYSVQDDHVHCIVEADDKTCLASGMKSVGARFARAVNRVFQRKGPVLDGRYHSRVLKTPREVRNALAYVLLNARKHVFQRTGRKPSARIDPISSGIWFQGWKGLFNKAPPYARETALPQFWLLQKGWRRHRLISIDELPGC